MGLLCSSLKMIDCYFLFLEISYEYSGAGNSDNHTYQGISGRKGQIPVGPWKRLLYGITVFTRYNLYLVLIMSR